MISKSKKNFFGHNYIGYKLFFCEHFRLYREGKKKPQKFLKISQQVFIVQRWFFFYNLLYGLKFFLVIFLVCLSYCFFFFWKIWQSSRAHLAPKPLFTPPFLKNIPRSHPLFACGPLRGPVHPPFLHTTASRPCLHPLFRMRPLRGPVHTTFLACCRFAALLTPPFSIQKGSRLSTLSRKKKQYVQALVTLIFYAFSPFDPSMKKKTRKKMLKNSTKNHSFRSLAKCSFGKYNNNKKNIFFSNNKITIQKSVQFLEPHQRSKTYILLFIFIKQDISSNKYGRFQVSFKKFIIFSWFSSIIQKNYKKQFFKLSFRFFFVSDY